MDPYSYVTLALDLPLLLSPSLGDERSVRLPWLLPELTIRTKGRRNSSSPTCFFFFFFPSVLGWEIFPFLQIPPTSSSFTKK